MKRIKSIVLLFFPILFITCSENNLLTEVSLGDVELGIDIPSIRMISIPGGSFQMGDTAGEADEQPVHSVTVSKFQMSRYEITNIQYAAYLDTAFKNEEITATAFPSNIRGAKGDFINKTYINLSDRNSFCQISFNGWSFNVVVGKEHWPVVCVSWYGAKAFALKYNLDLPREAEWEYASRGGKQYEYGTDDGTISHLKANYEIYSLGDVVGSYPPNPFGLYDLAGHVEEWCNDFYWRVYNDQSQTDPIGHPTGESTPKRIIRGGGFTNSPYKCRSASRDKEKPDFMGYDLGFRVVRR